MKKSEAIHRIIERLRIYRDYLLSYKSVNEEKNKDK